LYTKGARVVRMFRAMSINHLSRIASHCPNTTLICHSGSCYHLLPKPNETDRDGLIGRQSSHKFKWKKRNKKNSKKSTAHQQAIDACLHQHAMVGLEKHQSVDGLKHMPVSPSLIIRLYPCSCSSTRACTALGSFFDLLVSTVTRKLAKQRHTQTWGST